MSDDQNRPQTTAGNGAGRAANGRFVTGNRLGKGNPLNRRSQLIRADLLRFSTPEDRKAIAMKVIEGAKAGDIAFITLYYNRTAGLPAQAEVLQRIEEIENLLHGRAPANRGHGKPNAWQQLKTDSD